MSSYSGVDRWRVEAVPNPGPIGSGGSAAVTCQSVSRYVSLAERGMARLAEAWFGSEWLQRVTCQGRPGSGGCPGLTLCSLPWTNRRLRGSSFVPSCAYLLVDVHSCFFNSFNLHLHLHSYGHLLYSPSPRYAANHIHFL